MRELTRFFCAVIVVAACARQTAAEPATVAGRVVDERTGAPLAGALVYVESVASFSETDADGRFRLSLPPGTHTIVVSLIGYAMTRQIVETPAAAPTELIIRLPEGAGSFAEHVTVTGRAPDAADAAPAGATIHGRELQTVRGVMLDDPLRAVQALPSVSATDDFYSEFAVRGSAFRHIGLVVDGIPSRYLMHTVQGVPDSGSTVMINSEALGAVSLLPGSYPQRTGRRLGAEVDLATRDGSRDGLRARAGLSGTSATMLAEGPIGSRRGSWLASARRSYLDLLVKRLDDEAFAFGFTDAQAKIVYDVTPRHQVQVLAIAGSSDFEEPPDRLGVNDEARATNRGWLTGLTWRYTPTARFTLSQRLYATGVNFTNTSRTGAVLDDGTSIDVGWRADASAAITPRWLVEVGGDAQALTGAHQQSRTLDGQTTATVLSDYSRRGRAASAYAESSITLSPVMIVTPGARFDYWGLTGDTDVSPWLTMEWPITARTRVRAGTGVYRQFPHFEELFGLRGGSALRPERATHVDAAITQTIVARTTVQLAWFERREHDVMWTPGAEPRRLPDGAVQPGRGDAPWTNALEGRARGVEVMIRRDAPDGLSGWAGYSYARLRYTDPLRDERFWADADQRHTVSLFANYRLSSRASLSSKFRYGSNYPLVGYIGEQAPGGEAPRLLGGDRPVFYGLVTDRNRLRLPAYARLDIRADRTFAWSARRLTLFLEVVNALNRTNVRNVPYGVDRNGRVVGPTDPMIPILPSAGVAIEF